MSHSSQGSAPLRVLMVSKACIVGIYQRKLEEIAADPAVDLTVVVPPYWKDQRGRIMLERAYTSGYRLEVMDMRFNGSFHFHYYPHLKRIVEDVQPDIIHIDEEPYNVATAQALSLARRAGARTLFFSWQNIYRRYPPPFSSLEQWVLRHADHALVGNDEAIGVWQKKGFTRGISLVPQFGVDPNLFSPAEPAQREHFTIGYAGRLVPEKGLDTLIKAVALLEGKWALRLLGDGPQRGDLARIAGLYNISGSVDIQPPVPSVEMPDFYRGLDAFVLPSLTRPNWKEQFGRVLIEAMSSGVPVIGSSSGAIPGVIGEAGLTFPEGNAEALAEHLQALMQYRALHRQLAEAGRQRVLAQFTHQQIAQQTVHVYHQLI